MSARSRTPPAPATEFDLAARFIAMCVAEPDHYPDTATLQQKSLLYAAFKQRNIGKCNIPEPSIFNAKARYKWTAWKKLGDMSREDAEQLYVNTCTQIYPQWRSDSSVAEDLAKVPRLWCTPSPMPGDAVVPSVSAAVASVQQQRSRPPTAADVAMAGAADADRDDDDESDEYLDADHDSDTHETPRAEDLPGVTDEERFELAVFFVRHNAADMPIGRDALYPFYKQATAGRPAKSSKPTFSPTKIARWEKWNRLGDEVTREQAKAEYVNLLTRLMPDWESWPPLQRKRRVAFAADAQIVPLFDSAVDYVRRYVSMDGNNGFNALYGLYKQATSGKCTVPPPAWSGGQARARWDAWKALGEMPMDVAKAEYVRKLSDLQPSWEEKALSSLASSSPFAADNDDSQMLHTVRTELSATKQNLEFEVQRKINRKVTLLRRDVATLESRQTAVESKLAVVFDQDQLNAIVRREVRREITRSVYAPLRAFLLTAPLLVACYAFYRRQLAK